MNEKPLYLSLGYAPAKKHAPESNPSERLQFRDAVRIQESLTSIWERNALRWLRMLMPGWVNSDHHTLLGFAASFFAGASYGLARWNTAGFLLATFFLGVNWFGDSLDGTLARVRNCQRPRYGFYVDHMA